MIAVFAIVAIPVVYAINIVAEGFKSDSAAPALTIDAHGVCKKVTNISGKSYFIPTKISNEWSAFRSNLPFNVTLEDCVVSLCPAAGGTNFAGYTTATYTGGMGGVVAADALCAAEFPGSRMANSTELKCIAPAQGAWLRDQPVSSGSDWSTAHCYSWTSGAYSSSFNPFGVAVRPTGAFCIGAPLFANNCGIVSTCDISRSIACAY